VKIKAEGGFEEKEFVFVVEPEPCEEEAKLEEEYIEPFRGQKTNLYKSAPELKCVAGKVPGKKVLEGAVLSDHGYPIIGMIHESVPADEKYECKDGNTDKPGRMQKALNGKGQYQSACELKSMCAKRAKQGYNSGMGLIFRKVAGIGSYKDVCVDGEEEPEMDVEASESEESENVCAGKNRAQCKKLKQGSDCSWNAADLRCYSAKEVKDMLGIWFQFNGTFKSFKTICSDPQSPDRCKACGGKRKTKGKKSICQLTIKQTKCPRITDNNICSVVNGCIVGKNGCRGAAEFTN